MENGNAESNSITFHINGEKHSVVNNQNGINARTALADYIRDVALLKGTKIMCREGGCGACIVTAKVKDPATGTEIVKSVNSCLTPVLSCDGWDISTVELLGNKHEGYHEIQNRLVKFHGTQCGFCTPGMVMTMHSLIGTKKEVKMEDVESCFDGNICRCTGYRPILDAFKVLCKDAPFELQQKCADIEECGNCPLRKNNSSGFVACGHRDQVKMSAPKIMELSSGEKWITAKSVRSALIAAAECNPGKYRFVAGNTSTGIFKNDDLFQTYIDINGIPDLKKSGIEENGFMLGGATTLTECINTLKDVSTHSKGLEYTGKIATHLQRVANTSVRNNGTIAGNLMIKHTHRDFPSDIFVLLEGVGAKITLASLKSKRDGEDLSLDEAKTMTLPEFLKTDMNQKLVTAVHLPQLEGFHFRTFKITRRYQNTHAYINAALLLKVDKIKYYEVKEKPRLVFGGVSPDFIHASKTEEFMDGKNISNVKTLQNILEVLQSEVMSKMESGPRLLASSDYRAHLTKSLLYKTILEIIGNDVSLKFRSGANDIPRHLLQNKQILDGEASEKALYKSVLKCEGAIQSSGEAEYTADIPIQPKECYGAFVLSTVACADLKKINATEALAMPGVVAFISAEDIPGENNAVNNFNYFPMSMPEPVFAQDKISYNGQAVGLIVATSRDLAYRAAKMVNVTYANEQKPVVNIMDSIEKAKADGSFEKQTFGTHTTKPDDDIKIVHTLKGSLTSGSQYHFHMEPQSCVCHPTEDGIDVYSSTQWMDFAQISIANVLAIPMNAVNMRVRRIGGGFGAKLTRPAYVATACALATWITKRPVRLILDLETNMRMLGKRLPTHIPYEVGFDEKGRIGKLDLDLISDNGFTPNEPGALIGLIQLQSLYKARGWNISGHFVLTNTPANTYCRAPGSIKANAALELIMDQIADHLKMDPITVREANLLEKGDPLVFAFVDPDPTFKGQNLMPEIIQRMKKEAEYESRCEAVKKFNKNNRWKKRGMGVVPLRFGIHYFGVRYPASVVIYRDGTVAVCHGGIEMGQGINTKAMQVASEYLDVPMNKIKVKPSNNYVGANAFGSGASITSDMVCYATMRSCKELQERLKKHKETMENKDASWEELIESAYRANVKLTADHQTSPGDNLEGYDVWALNLTEVEIDVLTGEYKILRADIYEDTGNSLSPAVDLGQIEGSYMFGLGYWTTEKILHDPEDGKLLTAGTWDYKPPEFKDLPEDFRVTVLNKAPNPTGVLRSKASGEPCVNSAFAVVLAMRNAIASARSDAGNTEWFQIDGPVTPEDIARLCLTQDSHFTT